MVVSYPGIATYHHQSLSFRITIGGPDNMSHRSGHGSNSRGFNSGQASSSHGPNGRGGNSPYPFTTLSPARTNLLSRRQNMTVQDMLNPSDEEPRGSSQSRPSPPSSDNGNSQRHVQGAYCVNQPPRSTRGHSVHAAIRRNTHRAHRHQSRRSSSSSSSSASSEASERERRGVREQYTLEQTHFIW